MDSIERAVSSSDAASERFEWRILVAGAHDGTRTFAGVIGRGTSFFSGTRVSSSVVIKCTNISRAASE